jgi:hypothetical protein
MSRIFEALREAEEARAIQKGLKAPKKNGPKVRERRRSPRLAAEIPVLVYGWGANGKPFYVEASTVTVNRNGALLRLQTPLNTGDELLITNKATNQDQVVRIVRIVNQTTGLIEAGVAFLVPDPAFWQIAEETDENELVLAEPILASV